MRNYEPFRPCSPSPDIPVAPECSESSIKRLAVNEFPPQHIPGYSFALCHLPAFVHIIVTAKVGELPEMTKSFRSR
jgi:hypothetical protein